MEPLSESKSRLTQADIDAIGEKIEQTTGVGVHYRYSKPDRKMSGWNGGNVRRDDTDGSVELLRSHRFKQQRFVMFEPATIQSIEIVTLRGSASSVIAQIVEMLILFYVIFGLLSNLSVPVVLRWIAAAAVLLLFVGAATLRARAPVPGIRVRHLASQGEPDIVEMYVKGLFGGVEEKETLRLSERIYGTLAKYGYRGAAPATEDDSAWRPYRRVLKAAVGIDVLLGVLFLLERFAF